jgi:carbonic anhydrase
VNKCNGLSQTPINISVNFPIDTTLFYPNLNVTNGGCYKYTSFADDHAFEINFVKSGHTCTNQKLRYKGTEYMLIQGHTHAVSEHTYKGYQPDAEVTAFESTLLLFALIQ